MPEALSALVITGAEPAAAPIVRTKVAVPVPAAFVALIVVFVVPAAVGVPEMRPLLVLTLKPDGNPVALKLVGPLLAAIHLEQPFALCNTW